MVGRCFACVISFGNFGLVWVLEFGGVVCWWVSCCGGVGLLLVLAWVCDVMF